MLSFPGISRGDRYVKISGNEASPPYLATYIYENWQAIENYRKHPLRGFLKYAGWEKFPNKDGQKPDPDNPSLAGDYIACCHVSYRHLASFDKNMLDDGGCNTERILQITGVDANDDVNKDELRSWYSDILIPLLLTHRGVIKADQYEKVDMWGPGDLPPAYLIVCELADEAAAQDFTTGHIARNARYVEETRWQNSLNTVWRANYRRMGTWYKEPESF
jgi:hypothetical protein